MSSYSPIILFTYNRLKHTKNTIENLQKNYLAKDSELFIYSDGGKDEESWDKVNTIREYLETISGFKNITIIKREKNIGLAQNIIDGVTKIVNQYGKIIVLEDDIVTSPYFLNFMNDSLNFYEKRLKIWHISGWNYPISNENLNDTFLWRTMNCWGWGTWKDRWNNYEKNPKKLIESFSKDDIYKFNLDGATNFWEQIEKNHNKQMNTWAIFWYTTIFKNQGLCMNPTQSFVENIGFDGTGTNTGYRDNYSSNLSRQKSNFVFVLGVAIVQVVFLFQKLHKQVLVKNQRAFHINKKLFFQVCIVEQQSNQYFVKVLCFVQHHPFFQFSVVCHEVGFFLELLL